MLPSCSSIVCRTFQVFPLVFGSFSQFYWLSLLLAGGDCLPESDFQQSLLLMGRRGPVKLVSGGNDRDLLNEDIF